MIDLNGGEVAHLELTVLGNELRYARIKTDDGKESYEAEEYSGLVTLRNESPRSGSLPSEERYTATTKKPHVIRINTDLGSGFQLKQILPKHNGYETITSYVGKTFSVEGKDVEIAYSITPPSQHQPGLLDLSFLITEPKTTADKLDLDGIIRTGGTFITYRKTMEVEIHDVCRQNGTADPFSYSSLLITYELTNYPSFGAGKTIDQIKFEFGMDGNLESIHGMSETSAFNPELSDDKVSAAIKKGKDEEFEYLPKEPEAQLLAQAIFGHDITHLRHNTRESLTALMEAAIRELDIDVVKALKFQ